MTPSELSTLKQMSFRERWKKYTPMLMSRVLKQEQYDYILKLPYEGETSPGDSENSGSNQLAYSTDRGVTNEVQEVADTIIEAFGGHIIATDHPDAPKGNTQKGRLLNLLSDRQWHTTVEIMESVYQIDGQKEGICRIASRMTDLRNDGHKIESERDHGTVWKYRLVS